VSYFDKYSKSARNRFFNSTDTLVVRAQLLNEPYHSAHLGLPHGYRVPALISHLGIGLAQIFFVAQGVANLTLSLFSPAKILPTFIGLALDVGSFLIKAVTILLAVVGLFTRSLATICNYGSDEQHSLFDGDCFIYDCKDVVLENLVENFGGAEPKHQLFNL
jgi:hypothetical protein